MVVIHRRREEIVAQIGRIGPLLFLVMTSDGEQALGEHCGATSHVVLLQDNSGKTQLGGSRSGRHTAATGANNYDIEVLHLIDIVICLLKILALARISAFAASLRKLLRRAVLRLGRATRKPERSQSTGGGSAS